ncbi:MAG TPA: alpha/beta hydrolase [Mycobacteriales bacterium]|nr:alpha/beta hydrolase [Mycobacteriales bacterium]
MSRTTHRVGIAGGMAGAGAAAAAAGIALGRYAIGRSRRTGPDTEAGEPFGRLAPDRRRTVTADDGTPLYLEEVGPADAPLTVLFVHGYCLSLGCWHYQRLGLADTVRPALRMVFYDQRGHGRSAGSAPDGCTIDQLGADLYTVLRDLGAEPGGRHAPTPVVLVGHSMGGMTIMALAEAHPELFGERIVGVALLSTSTGKLAEVTFGLPALLARAKNPVLPRLVSQLRRRARMAERGRHVGGDLVWLFVRRMGFGSKDASSAQVDYVADMIAGTPIHVIADFYPALVEHDKLHALPVLRGIPVLVLVGERDVVTPASHSRAIAEALPDAELVEVEGAGHLVIMERAPVVNLRLRAFVHRAYRQANGGRWWHSWRKV